MKPTVVQPVDANMVVWLAETIGNCDFQVTVQRYSTGNGRPWVITVGENRWQRHLVVEEISGDNARLGILPMSESSHFGYGLHTNEIERSVTLIDLVADGYRGVKKWLCPVEETPASQRPQLAADIADSQSH